MEKLRFRPKLENLERRETPSGSGSDAGSGNTSVPPPQIIIEPEIKIIIVPPPH
jgi:hypothetical protein